MRVGLICSAAMAALWLAGGIADAETTVFARSGPWRAFGGTSTDGTQVCGIATDWPDNRYFGVKYYKGDTTLTIQLGNPKWQIEDNAKQRVVMQIDQNAQWTASASGMHFSQDEAGLQFEIAANQLSIFVEQFRDGDQLYLSFPGADVPDWTASLGGTQNMIGSFANCVKAM